MAPTGCLLLIESRLLGDARWHQVVRHLLIRLLQLAHFHHQAFELGLHSLVLLADVMITLPEVSGFFLREVEAGLLGIDKPLKVDDEVVKAKTVREGTCVVVRNYRPLQLLEVVQSLLLLVREQRRAYDFRLYQLLF